MDVPAEHGFIGTESIPVKSTGPRDDGATVFCPVLVCGLGGVQEDIARSGHIFVSGHTGAKPPALDYNKFMKWMGMKLVVLIGFCMNRIRKKKF